MRYNYAILFMYDKRFQLIIKSGHLSTQSFLTALSLTDEHFVPLRQSNRSS